MSDDKKYVKTNCRNRVFIEGYVENLKAFKETRQGYTERPVLKFELHSINSNGNNEVFDTPIDVELHKNRAIEVGKWIKEGALVEVESILRKLPNGNFMLQGLYVNDATPRMKVIILNQEESEK